MSRLNTLIEYLQALQGESSGITFIKNDVNEVYLSYKDLYCRALNYLYVLQARGIRSGEELVLQVEENEYFIIIFWACILGGIIPVPVQIGNNDEHKLKLLKIWEILNHPHLITSSECFESLENYMNKSGKNDLLCDIKGKTVLMKEFENIIESGNIYMCRSEEIAYIQFSSGSTSEPKGIVLKHENLISNINAIIHCSEITTSDSSLSWLPLTHDMGLIGFHLTPLLIGINQYIMPTQLFVKNPVLWINKAVEHKTTILSSPNFGYQYFLSRFKPKDEPQWDLSHVRLIYNGAEPISYKTVKSFLQLMGKYNLRETSMFSVYGMAEASLAVTFPNVNEDIRLLNLKRSSIGIGCTVEEIYAGTLNDDYVSFVDVGYPVDDCCVRICDDENRRLADNIIGNIQIMGKNVTSGYYNNPKATEKAFTEDGWLITGDLGFMREGRLTVTGRVKDIIFIGGINYYPQDIERVAELVNGAEGRMVVACGVLNEQEQREEVILFVCFKGGIESFIPLAYRMKRYVSGQIGVNIKSIIPVKKIPKTTSGKVQRYKLGEMYKRGEFSQIVDEMGKLLEEERDRRISDSPITETERKIMKVIKGILGIDVIGVNEDLTELGVDSIKLVKIHANLEELYPGKLTVANIFGNPSISKLSRFLENGGNIITSAIRLPDDYFNRSNDSEANCFLEFEFDGILYNKIKELCCKEDLGLEDILLAVYMFLMSQISCEKAVTVQTMVGSANSIIPVSINFNEVTDFNTLLKSVKHKAHETGNKNAYFLQDLERLDLNKESNSVVPLFYKKNLKLLSIKISQAYDIIFEISEDNGHAGVVCEFNGRLLDKDKMKVLCKIFINMVYDLTEKCRQYE